MLLPALAAALAALGLSLLILLALQVTEAQEFAPLPATGEDMRRYAEAGYFPLMAAASAAGRHALAAGASLQTFGGLALIFAAVAYSARRGFLSKRLRGWSNSFWISSVAALTLAPSVFHGLTPQTLDYLVTAYVSHTSAALPELISEIYGAGGLNSRMLPAVFILERGLLAAALAAFLAVVSHDIGYRLREVLEDFGVAEPDEDRQRQAPSEANARSAGSRRRASQAGTTEQGDFGQREAPPTWNAATGEETRARFVLGVGVSATRREIERAYRAQMQRAHPDHGGSVERAAALNAARDVLLGR